MLRHIIPHLFQAPLVFTFLFQLPWEAMTKFLQILLVDGILKINIWLIESFEVTWVSSPLTWKHARLCSKHTRLCRHSSNIRDCAPNAVSSVSTLSKRCVLREHEKMCKKVIDSFCCLHWATTLASRNGFLTKMFKERRDKQNQDCKFRRQQPCTFLGRDKNLLKETVGHLSLQIKNYLLQFQQRRVNPWLLRGSFSSHLFGCTLYYLYWPNSSHTGKKLFHLINLQELSMPFVQVDCNMTPSEILKNLDSPTHTSSLGEVHPPKKTHVGFFGGLHPCLRDRAPACRTELDSLMEGSSMVSCGGVLEKHQWLATGRAW